MNLITTCIANGVLDKNKLSTVLESAPIIPLSDRSIRDGHVAEGSLVRFRGMVQDMFDPELFCLSYNNGMDSGMFRDSVPSHWKESGSQVSHLGEREILCLVPVPGESTWATNLMSATTSTTSTQDKRSRYWSELNDDVKLEDMSSSSCVIIKLYEHSTLQNRRPLLHDVVNVVGLLSFDHDPNGEDAKDFLPCARIHVLTLQFHQTYVFPVHAGIPLGDTSRMLCRNFFQQNVVQNDVLAAEFLLLWALSRAEHSSHSTVRGKFSLALLNLETNPLSSSKWSQQIFPAAQVFNFEDLSRVHLCPQKNLSENRLRPGKLQVSAGTRIILDETLAPKKEGVLDAQCVHNILALQHLARSQQVEYDFSGGFTRMHDVDAPLLVLSSSKRKALCLSAEDVDMVVSVHASSSSSSLLPHPAMAHECQVYLESARFHSDVELSPHVAQLIEDDFVSERKQHGQHVTDRDLHVWLTLARLQAKSWLRNHVTMEDYSRAKSMHREAGKRQNNNNNID